MDNDKAKLSEPTKDNDSGLEVMQTRKGEKEG